MKIAKTALVAVTAVVTCCISTCGIALLAEVDDQSTARPLSPLVGHWYTGVDAVSQYTRDVSDDWKGPGGSGSEFTFRANGTCSMDSVRTAKVADFCSSSFFMGTDDCTWSQEDDVLRISLGERTQYTRACGASELKRASASPTELRFRIDYRDGLPVLNSEGEGQALDLRRAP